MSATDLFAGKGGSDLDLDDLGVYTVKRWEIDYARVKGTSRTYAVCKATLEGDGGRPLCVQWLASNLEELKRKLVRLHGPKNPEIGQVIELRVTDTGHGLPQARLRPTTPAQHLLRILEREGL
jgi:hypothetical protein